MFLTITIDRFCSSVENLFQTKKKKSGAFGVNSTGYFAVPSPSSEGWCVLSAPLARLSPASACGASKACPSSNARASSVHTP